ncbi:MAG: hypothetical protein AABX34_04440 [Nanoarchaeota archaeon]|mgnify:CR=1 FL=1
MKKYAIGLIMLLALALISLVGCTEEKQDNNTTNPEELIKEQPKGFGGITEQQCIEANGHWNECGSPCAGTDAEVCIQMCQVQCECGGIAGFNCPEGYKCRLSGKIMDELGVCVPDK